MLQAKVILLTVIFCGFMLVLGLLAVRSCHAQ